MNCTELMSSLGFDCESIGARTVRLHSPFTYPTDGEHIGLYLLEQDGDHFRVTDNAESLFHAAALGINLTKRRIDSLRRIAGPSVEISDGGEIFSRASRENVGQIVTAVLNASLAASHMEPAWAPRSRNAEFTEAVAQVLRDEVHDRLLKGIQVTGASGHQIEIPLAVRQGNQTIYIQPVGYGEERVDWDNVYRGFGKMMDLRNAGAEDGTRAIVIEDAANDPELPKAITLLSNCATVIYFSKLVPWAKKLAA